MKYTALGLMLALAACLAACSNERSDETKQQSLDASERDTTIRLRDSGVRVAGLLLHPPAAWADLGPRAMRMAQYAYGPVAGETDSATVAVYYFGPHSGGTTIDNIERWIGQMMPPDDSDPHIAARHAAFAVNGLAVQTVELTGTYVAPVGGPMAAETIEKEDYRLVGAVVEGPQGNVYLKLTGPDSTASAMAGGFRAMLHAIQKTP